LWNGGFRQANVQFKDEFNRKDIGVRPIIDLYKNVDSLAEVKKENEIIFSLIQTGKMDTTGSINGVFYKILKEGTGKQVSVNDTLVLYYKGQLLNGFVFDQTKDKPATFPLKRLIKGWQMGLPFCREGGKIQLIIPSPLAYSIRNLGVIPPNSTLVFDIEVLEIKK
jgi:FKBP-type peptidyl-prolyl cis-trans isomerase